MRRVQSDLELALRVLTAVNEYREPEPTDLVQLRRLAPDWASRPTDLLACEVIQRAVQRARVVHDSARY